MAEERQSQSQEMHGKEESKGGGIGLGLGVGLNITLGGLRSVLDELDYALKSTTDTVTDTLSNIYNKIREMGPQSLQQWGSESEEQRSAYDQLVEKLRSAADRGEQEARNLLSEMGESVESVGQTMQEKAQGEESAPH